MRRSRTLAALALAWPAIAHAHAVATGAGSFLDGLWHWLCTPEDVVPVLAFAALAGQNGATVARFAGPAVGCAWIAGGIWGYRHGVPEELGAWPALSFLLPGFLVALARPLPKSIIATLAMALGLFHGALQGAFVVELHLHWVAVLGSAFGVTAVSVPFAWLVLQVRPPWARIAVRVGGSWVAAVGVLMAGWALRR